MAVSDISTPDIADEFPAEVQAMELDFRNFGGIKQFCGEVVTIKCHEDNSLVREMVGTAGLGRIIVVDGGGSRRHALLGDMLAEKASANGWSGLIINGVIRDVDQIATIALGVQALGTVPLKTEKHGVGQQDIPLRVGGVFIHPGDYIYADNNGVLLAHKKLL
ncbi:MAG: ribonuclease E activity regulator RraA [Halieaceae bacterium]